MMPDWLDARDECGLSEQAIAVCDAIHGLGFQIDEVNECEVYGGFICIYTHLLKGVAICPCAEASPSYFTVSFDPARDSASELAEEATRSFREHIALDIREGRLPNDFRVQA